MTFVRYCDLTRRRHKYPTVRRIQAFDQNGSVDDDNNYYERFFQMTYFSNIVIILIIKYHRYIVGYREVTYRLNFWVYH